jgi:hypothetical protein
LEITDQSGDQLARSLGLPHQPLKILFGQVALIEPHVQLSPNLPARALGDDQKLDEAIINVCSNRLCSHPRRLASLRVHPRACIEVAAMAMMSVRPII